MFKLTLTIYKPNAKQPSEVRTLKTAPRRQMLLQRMFKEICAMDLERLHEDEYDSKDGTLRLKIEAAQAAPRKPQPKSTPKERQRARARRWRKTGVSAATVEWMRKNRML